MLIVSTEFKFQTSYLLITFTSHDSRSTFTFSRVLFTHVIQRSSSVTTTVWTTIKKVPYILMNCVVESISFYRCYYALSLTQTPKHIVVLQIVVTIPALVAAPPCGVSLTHTLPVCGVTHFCHRHSTRCVTHTIYKDTHKKITVKSSINPGSPWYK